MSGFSNPIVGGGGALVYPSIHSPNYSAPLQVGWSINKDGTAQFNGVTINGALGIGLNNGSGATASIQETPSPNPVFKLTSSTPADLNNFYVVGPSNNGSVNYANINLALANSGGVILTPGTYPLDGPIRLNTGNVVIGNGATLVPSLAFGSGTGMIILNSSTVTDTYVENVILLDTYQVIGCAGVYYNTSTSVPNNNLRRVVARGWQSHGFRLGASAGSASAHAENCVAFGNLGNGFDLSSDQLLVNCEAGFNLGHGFYGNVGASNIYLVNCLSWYSGRNAQTNTWPGSGTSCGYFFDNNSQYCHAVGCHAQQNGLHGYAIGATSGTTGFAYQVGIIGCGADTNSAYANNVGSGIFLSGVQECDITGNVGGNNAGLTPGIQLWGIRAPGGLVRCVFGNNSITGSSGKSQIASRFVPMTLLNSWANNASFQAAQYTLLDSPPNTLEIIGAIDATAATSATFATLPANFRPAKLSPGISCGNNGGGIAGQTPNVRCDTAGNLTLNNATVPSAATFMFHGYISLDAT